MCLTNSSTFQFSSDDDDTTTHFDNQYSICYCYLALVNNRHSTAGVYMQFCVSREDLCNMQFCHFTLIAVLKPFHTPAIKLAGADMCIDPLVRLFTIDAASVLNCFLNISSSKYKGFNKIQDFHNIC